MVTEFNSRITRLIILKCVFLFIFLSKIVLSMDVKLEKAYTLYKNNELVIIDIRTKNEWLSTGVIPGSILLNMHDDDYKENLSFIKSIEELLSKNRKKNIAFICASGARSKIVLDHFVSRGYENLSHIPDGIVGKNQDGWIFRSYPIKYLEKDKD